MNRFKKELMRKGIKLEHQFDCMPYEVRSGIIIDSIIVDSENAIIHMYYNVIDLHYHMERNGSIVDVPTIDGNPKF